MTVFWLVFWMGMTVLAVVAGVSLRVRLREGMQAPPPVVDDDAIRRILEEGVLEDGEDPPLDPEEIDAEERRFWSENWDEPEAW